MGVIAESTCPVPSLCQDHFADYLRLYARPITYIYDSSFHHYCIPGLIREPLTERHWVPDPARLNVQFRPSRDA